uniref:Uncharacterized protein n=1 Tax=Rhizophora mucronata TaxID=61149 RepID=A0A2P2Q8G0_RHIMU
MVDYYTTIKQPGDHHLLVLLLSTTRV